MNKDLKISLRAQAHHLKPVVMVGQDGLTLAVLKEIDISLKAHNLIKIRVLGDNAQLRKDIAYSVENNLKANIIQTIGKLLVIYRLGETILKHDELKLNIDKKVKLAAPREVKVRKFTRSTRRPPLKTLTVLGNQRVTAGGLVKRRKIRQVSQKKIQLG